VDDAQTEPALPEKETDGVGSWTTRELLISSVAGVRGAITLAGVLSIPLLLPDGNVFPARYELVFLAAGVILFSLFVGVIVLPILLRHIESTDHVQQRKEERLARRRRRMWRLSRFRKWKSVWRRIPKRISIISC
jgi:NhaP-type Na+/H+ or K+/H+ antiporter